MRLGAGERFSQADAARVAEFDYSWRIDVFGCYSCLFWAEKTLPSGLASVLVATLPLWTLILEALLLRNQRLTPALSVGLLLGFAGVLAISISNGGGMKGGQWLPTLAILVSEICWASGSILSKRLLLPEAQAVSAGGQMLTGGLILLAVSLAIGEPRGVAFPSHKALFALAYLIVAGSIAAFSAYVWLLKRMGPTRLSSYAYVNPVVALALGYFLGGEQFQPGALVGSALVLASVVLILSKRGGSEVRKSTEEVAIESASACQDT